jgi:hypothetical protein
MAVANLILKKWNAIPEILEHGGVSYIAKKRKGVGGIYFRGMTTTRGNEISDPNG